MSLMERVMELMVRNMGPEKRERMMEEMMKKFFEDLSREEKQEMMGRLMPVMMSKMMSFKIPIREILKDVPMFRFMEKMVEEMERENFKPWKTCRMVENSLQELVKTHKEILKAIRENRKDL